MSTAYSWVISTLECYPQQDDKTDVVFMVHWRRQAIDGDLFAEVYGAQSVTLEPDAPFTPYADLTQEQVEGWLVDAMGEEQVAAMDAALAQQIADLINPPVVTPPLPWAAAPEAA
jgi:hypothetical protein